MNERLVQDTGVRAIVEEIDVATDIECGFRHGMFEATATRDDGAEIRVSATAAMGRHVNLEIDGRYFRLDIGKVAQALVEYVAQTERPAAQADGGSR